MKFCCVDCLLCCAIISSKCLGHKRADIMPIDRALVTATSFTIRSGRKMHGINVHETDDYLKIIILLKSRYSVDISGKVSVAHICLFTFPKPIILLFKLLTRTPSTKIIKCFLNVHTPSF